MAARKAYLLRIDPVLWNALEKWAADETGTVPDCTTSWCQALLWIVPARVAGSYDIPQGKLVLKQQFQMLSGTLRTEGKTYALQGRVRGEEVSFSAGGLSFQGRMNGKRLELR